MPRSTTNKESDSVRNRTMQFVRDDGQWTINGGTWDDVIASHFTKVLASPRTNDVEVWTLVNESGGWHHPAHIHTSSTSGSSAGTGALPSRRSAGRRTWSSWGRASPSDC